MRTVPPAIADALAKPAIPNGSRHRASVPSKRPAAERNGTVVVKQPAAGNWKCDACGKTGFGGGALLEHSGRTGHLRFSNLGYARLSA